MTDIAINPVTRRVQFTGNTGTGPFAFTFNILADADIAVYKNTTLLTLTTDYTVSTNANGTGSITLTSALVSSDVLTIIGGRQLQRTTDFVTAGDLLASSLNEQLDGLVIMTQQLDEKLDRSMKVGPGDEFTTVELPLKSTRANKYLAFDADGNPTATSGTTSTITVSTFGQSLVDDADAAAALVTLGLTATAAELNLMDGSSAGTVANSKGVVYSSAGQVIGTSLAVDNGGTDWTFEVSSNKLIIKYGGTAKMELDTTGNLKVTGDITAYGTIS